MTGGKLCSTLLMQKEKLGGWTFMKIALLYFALSADMISRDRLKHLVDTKVSTMLKRNRGSATAANAEDGGRKTLGQEKKEEGAKNKDACESGIELGICMLSDIDNKYRQHCLYTCGQPTLAWYQSCIHDMQSVSKNFEWCIDQLGFHKTKY